MRVGLSSPPKPHAFVRKKSKEEDERYFREAKVERDRIVREGEQAI